MGKFFKHGLRIPPLLGYLVAGILFRNVGKHALFWLIEHDVLGSLGESEHTGKVAFLKGTRYRSPLFRTEHLEALFQPEDFAGPASNWHVSERNGPAPPPGSAASRSALKIKKGAKELVVRRSLNAAEMETRRAETELTHGPDDGHDHFDGEFDLTSPEGQQEKAEAEAEVHEAIAKAEPVSAPKTRTEKKKVIKEAEKRMQRQFDELIPRQYTTLVRSIGLTTILMIAGLEIDPAGIARIGLSTVAKLTVFPGVSEAIGVGVLSHFVFRSKNPITGEMEGFPLPWGMTLGFILGAVSPAVVCGGMFALQKKGFGVAKGIPSLVVAAASLDDVVAISGFSTFIGIALAGSGTKLPAENPVTSTTATSSGRDLQGFVGSSIMDVVGQKNHKKNSKHHSVNHDTHTNASAGGNTGTSSAGLLGNMPGIATPDANNSNHLHEHMGAGSKSRGTHKHHQQAGASDVSGNNNTSPSHIGSDYLMKNGI